MQLQCQLIWRNRCESISSYLVSRMVYLYVAVVLVPDAVVVADADPVLEVEAEDEVKARSSVSIILLGWNC